MPHPRSVASTSYGARPSEGEPVARLEAGEETRGSRGQRTTPVASHSREGLEIATRANAGSNVADRIRTKVAPVARGDSATKNWRAARALLKRAGVFRALDNRQLSLDAIKTKQGEVPALRVSLQRVLVDRVRAMATRAASTEAIGACLRFNDEHGNPLGSLSVDRFRHETLYGDHRSKCRIELHDFERDAKIAFGWEQYRYGHLWWCPWNDSRHKLSLAESQRVSLPPFGSSSDRVSRWEEVQDVEQCGARTNVLGNTRSLERPLSSYFRTYAEGTHGISFYD